MVAVVRGEEDVGVVQLICGGQGLDNLLDTVDDVLEAVLHHHGSDTGQTDITHLALDLVKVQQQFFELNPYIF